MRTLIIDNYDSFTFNLLQLVAAVNGRRPLVVRNDEASWPELARLEFDNIILSPGPGRPERRGDFGVCADAIAHAEVPLLGVCLGHQGIGHVCGARVEHAPSVMHGRTSPVHHAGTGLFAGIPSPFEAARYHSLVLAPELSPELRATAWTSDGVLMALEHRTRPLWGVQFHPESIASEHGHRLLSNFRDLSRARLGARVSARAAVSSTARRPRPPAPSHGWRLTSRRLDAWIDPAAVFEAVFGSSKAAFWLDSSLQRPGLSRFSFMGDASGPFALRIRYDVALGKTTIESREGCEERSQSVFDVARAVLEQHRVHDDTLPFDFQCGLVGYFGYELKAECGGELVHRSALPDAQLLFADRLLAFDHEQACIHLVALSKEGAPSASEAWFDAIEARLAQLQGPRDAPAPAPHRAPPPPAFVRPLPRYVEDILTCQRAIAEGESYEVCLTNRIELPVKVDALALHRTLRAQNPAPHAAFLRFPEAQVVSSSPERFLRIDRRRRVESKPIKGTRRRGVTAEDDAGIAEELRTSEKDRAENLMIVDLVRNDLGRVCKIGSVRVPKLMDVETYATVHQLVSTIEGTLRDDVDAIDALRSAFPGGSMTGAPKRRTMQIIDALESSARGVYSGAIGYLGCNGTADLSVVIRTLVVTADDVSLGVGGAIVSLSDPHEECVELQVKAAALLHAVETLSQDPRARATPRP